MATALHLWDAHARAWAPRSSGHASLDALLGGGWSTGEVAEMCGPSAAGKSQLALASAVACALGGRGDTALYIATTTEPFARRARAMMHAAVCARVRACGGGDRRLLMHALPQAALAAAALLLARDGEAGGGAAAAASAATAAAFLERNGPAVEDALRGSIDASITSEVDAAAHSLRVVTALEWPSLQRILVALEAAVTAAASSSTEASPPLPPPLVAFVSRLRVIVLDSIAGIIVPILANTRAPQGHAAMTEAGAALHRLARASSAAVIVINSSTAEREGGGGGSSDVAQAPGGGGGQPTLPFGLPLRPSLGPSWYSVPHLSLLVTKTLRAAEGGVSHHPWRESVHCTILKSSRLWHGPAGVMLARGQEVESMVSACDTLDEYTW